MLYLNRYIVRYSEKNPDWLIWTDGCPDGESVKEMEQRVDRVINDITTFHEDYVARRNKGEDLPGGGDIVLITHGHFSRCKEPHFFFFSQTLLLLFLLTTSFLPTFLFHCKC